MRDTLAPVQHDIWNESSSVKDMLNNISLQIAGLATKIGSVKTELRDINSNMTGVFFELEQQHE